MKILSQKKAEGTYISTVVFVLIAVIFILYTVVIVTAAWIIFYKPAQPKENEMPFDITPIENTDPAQSGTVTDPVPVEGDPAEPVNDDPLFVETSSIEDQPKGNEQSGAKQPAGKSEWQVIEEKSEEDIARENVPEIVYRVVDFLMAEGGFTGTMSALLEEIGLPHVKPHALSRALSKFHDEVLLPLGITYSSVRVSSERNYVFTVADDSCTGSDSLTDASVKLDSAYSDDAHDAYDASLL